MFEENDFPRFFEACWSGLFYFKHRLYATVTNIQYKIIKIHKNFFLMWRHLQIKYMSLM